MLLLVRHPVLPAVLRFLHDGPCGMTLTSPVSLTPARRATSRQQPWRWGITLVLGLLFLGAFYYFLARSFFVITRAASWTTALGNLFQGKIDQDWSHGLLVPLISGIYLYQQREKLARMQPRVFWAGLPLLLAGLLSYVWWLGPGKNDMFQGYSMILALAGLVLLRVGPGMMRYLWFPILYLGLAVKVSPRLWEMLATKLQWIAAQSAGVTLNVLGLMLSLEAEVRGSTIVLYHHGLKIDPPLNIAEACAGLRMLMAFIALGVAVAFLSDRRAWQRAVLVLATLPVAVGVNVGRVTVLGLLYLVDPSLAKGSIHTFVGMLMLIPAFGVFLLIGWILDHAVDYGQAPSAGADRGSTPAPAPAPESAVPVDRVRVAWGLGMGGLWTLVALAVGAAGFWTLPTLMRDLGLLPVAALATAMLVAGVAGVALWQRRRERRAGPAWTAPAARQARQSLALGTAAGVLLLAAVGVHALPGALKWVLIKQPLPMRQQPYELARAFGPWTMLSEEPPLNDEMLQELGTKLYLSRVYVDSTLPDNAPGQVARLHLAYYTGTVDTVPHVPERCYSAGGQQAQAIGLGQVMLAGPAYHHDDSGLWISRDTAPTRISLPDTTIPVTVFTFSPQQAPDQASNVVYFFVANGRFLPTPDHVRADGFNPRDAYSYYCKIEVLWPGVRDRATAQKRTGEFLSDAMPQIMAMLPDWEEVKAGTWPPPPGGPAPGSPGSPASSGSPENQPAPPAHEPSIPH